MSRGLGRIQQSIVYALNGKVWVDQMVLYKEIFGEKYIDSKLQSFWRAIRTLEKRGIVKTLTRTYNGHFAREYGAFKTKSVLLSV